MSRRTQENIVAGLILLLFIGVLLETMNYGARASMVPNIIAGIGAVLMAAQLILQNVRSEASMQVDLMELISRRATGDEDGLPEHLRTDLAEAKRKQQATPEQTRGPGQAAWPANCWPSASSPARSDCSSSSARSRRCSSSPSAT